jgi:Spy/CpxP family protein refolding chaperone
MIAFQFKLEVMMIITTKKILSGCAIVGFAAFSLIAAAQDHTQNSCKEQSDPQACMHAKMDAFRAAHEAKLHDALKLTPAQEPAWKSFTDDLHQQMTATAAEHNAMPSRADMEKLPVPDRIEQHLAMEQKHLAMAQSRLTSLKTFYAVLTPEQKVTMDKAVEHFMRHHGHHHWHHDGEMSAPMP